jgi:hypothetical protein
MRREDFDFVINGTVLVISTAQAGGHAANVALEKLRSVGSLNLVGVVLNRPKSGATRLVRV